MARMAVSDWLYQNGYGHIYEEWLNSSEKIFGDISPEEYLQKEHPAVWRQYSESQNNEGGK